MPVLTVYDGKGELVADVVRSYPQKLSELGRKEEAIPRSVTAISIGETNCDGGKGDFYEARIDATGEENRVCSLKEALKWVKKKTGKSCTT